MTRPRVLVSVTAIAIFGLCQILLFSTVSVMLVRQSFIRGDESLRAAVATRDRLHRVRHAFNLLRDVELGERGYVITGDPVFLDPYSAARGGIDEDIKSFEDSQDPQTVALGLSMRAKLDYAEGLIDLRRREGLSAAVRETATQRGKHLMDMVRAQVAKVTATEIGERDRLAARRAAEERRDEVVIYAVLVTTQLLSLIAGGLLFWRARRRDAALIHRATPETVGPGIVFLDAEGRPAAAPP